MTKSWVYSIPSKVPKDPTIMARCIHRGSVTELIVSSFPVCVTCDGKPKKTAVLLEAHVRLHAARAHWKAAKRELSKADEIVDSLPKGHLDGTQALRNANATLKKAGEDLDAALSDYLRTTAKGRAVWGQRSGN